MPYKSHAQELLPATFRRVTNLSQANSTGYYLIGALNENGDLHFMSTRLNNKNKLLGIKDAQGVRNAVEVNDPKIVWQIAVTEPGICTLTDGTGGKGTLRRTADNKLGLNFHAETDELSLWKVEAEGDGTFRLSAPSLPTSSRNLAISRINDKDYGFDNYSTSNSHRLYLYQKQETALLLDGMTVALGSREYYRDKEGTAKPTDSLLLADHTLAQTEDMRTYSVGMQPDGSFTLSAAETECFLDYSLQLSATAARWRATDGYIETCEASPRRIAFLPHTRQWDVISPESHEADDAETAILHPVAESPQRQDTDNGVCILSGGWGASALSHISCEGINCLDLTQIALPQRATDFASLPLESNIPIFVKESETSYAPPSWRFVVACGTGGNSPTMSLLLSDRHSLYTDRPIKFAAGTLHYRRRFTEGHKWQTLCLPFRADVPENCRLLQYGGSDETGTLTFLPAQEIEPQKAYIVCLNSDAPPIGKLVDFSNTDECVLSPEKTATPPFEGTWQNLSVTSSAERIYMLYPGGKQFVLAAPGSSLPAFRAWLRPDAPTGTRTINWRQAQ